MRAFLTAIAAGAVVLVFSGCEDALAPYHPEITSATDNFQLQATGVQNVTATLTYKWSNTGSRATVNHSTTVTAGTARVVIRDAANAHVYDAALVPSLNETTESGTSGLWTIELRRTNYSGTLNFRVQKV